jgi:hypothetical protein
MRGGLIGGIGWVAGALAFMFAIAAGAAAEQGSPRAIVYQLIDQLQTGQPRPVDLAPAMRKVIAEQTGNTGMYPSLAKLGIVTYVRIDSTTPMQRGTVYSVTATHDKGVSTWQVGIAADTQRVEYVEFKIAKSTATTPTEAAKPPQAGTKPLAPRADAAPLPSYPSTPSTGLSTVPSAVPPAALPPASERPASAPPAAAPRMATPAETSAACQKFPNLC